jgi:hypothetical protein
MLFVLSNWIFFFPIACGLGIILAVSGEPLERPRNDWLRLAMRILIWQLLILAFVGLVFRLTPLHFIWIFVALAFAIQTLLWEYGLARSTLMLVVLATEGVPQRLERVTHYLITESSGYWRRLGQRMDRALRACGDWMVAIECTRLVRGASDLQALGILRRYGRSDLLLTELSASSEQKLAISQMLGRLVGSSLGFLMLGLTAGLGVRITLLRMFEEFSIEGESNHDYYELLDRLAQQWRFDLWLPALIWGGIGLLFLIKLFPFLTRIPPLEWFFRSYYRAVSLRGLATVITAEPQLSVACRASSEISIVPLWSRRLAKAAQRIEAGEPIDKALRRARVIGRREASAIALASNRESLAWTLDEIAETATRRTWNRIAIIAQVATVLLVLAAAILVCLLALSVFSRLAQWTMQLT